MVKITYNGHACFTLECGGYRTVLDPYAADMIEGLPALNLEAEAVYCSHSHGDHNYTDAVSILPTRQKAPYTLQNLDSFHDDKGGTLRGHNVVRIFHFDDLRVAHLGDLGHLPEGALLEALKGVDCLLIPVGGFFTIDADAAAKIVAMTEPRVTVPMHYRTDTAGIGVIAHLTDFTGRYENVNSCDNTFVLTKDTQKQVLVINYKP